MRHTNYRNLHFKPAVVAAGLPAGVRVHDLRHTVCLLADPAGRPPEGDHGATWALLDHDDAQHLRPLVPRLGRDRRRGSRRFTTTSSASAAHRARLLKLPNGCCIVSTCPLGLVTRGSRSRKRCSMRRHGLDGDEAAQPGRHVGCRPLPAVCIRWVWLTPANADNHAREIRHALRPVPTWRTTMAEQHFTLVLAPNSGLDDGLRWRPSAPPARRRTRRWVGDRTGRGRRYSTGTRPPSRRRSAPR